MKEFVIPLLGTIFVLLLADSIESVAADHLEPGEGIWKDENRVNLVTTKDSKYQVHLQVEVRNAQGQLISISETSHVNHIPHEITDNTFNTMLGKKEIITIDDIEYEIVQFSDSFERTGFLDMSDHELAARWVVEICGEIHGHDPKCMSVFQASTAAVLVTQTDVVTNHWTILRVMN